MIVNQIDILHIIPFGIELINSIDIKSNIT